MMYVFEKQTARREKSHPLAGSDIEPGLGLPKPGAWDPCGWQGGWLLGPRGRVSRKLDLIWDAGGSNALPPLGFNTP